MDDQNSGAEITSDEVIADQLRQYADALASRATNAPAAIDVDHPGPRRWRRPPVIAVAAALALVVGITAWVGSNDNADSIRSTSDEETSTTLDDPAADPDESLGAPTNGPLMPDPNRWVITEAYEPETSNAGSDTGVWAWRLDGKVFVLVDGLAADGLGELEEAEIEAGEGRLMIGWLHEDRPLGLQGYGVDEATLRSVAVALTTADSGWTLPGGEVLVAEGLREPGPAESVQVGYSPLAADGTADLSAVVTSVRREGSLGDLFLELFEASSLGSTVETTVDGAQGFLVAGSFGSYGLVFADGWVSTWQTTSPDIDLAGFMRSVRTVTAEEWDDAVEAVDEVVSQAVAATAAELGSDADRFSPTGDPDLPRYRLPEPWVFEWVTDMGLWSAEERAQREALHAANAPPGGASELVWTQGFGRAGRADQGTGSLPFPVPEILVQVYRYETIQELDTESEGFEAFSFAGLDGYIERAEMYDPAAETGSRTEFWAGAAQGPLVVSIRAATSSEAEVRRFAESLSIAGDDASRGVASSGGEFELLVELPDGAGGGGDFFSRWHAAFTTPDGDAGQRASISVESATFEQLQIRMMSSGGDGTAFEPVAGGRYLANQYEREDLVFDEEGKPVDGETLRVVQGTSLLHYDPEDEILISLDLTDDLETTIALFEQLIEVDIDAWRELVADYNAKPLQPR